MHLRNRADIRTVIWAFLWMPGVAAAQYAVPALVGWLTPLSMYLAYSAGVIAHNHNHCPTWTGRRSNACFSIWLSLFYGFPTFAWIPTHNSNHHRFVNRPGDATCTWQRTRQNGLFAATTFFFVSAAGQAPLIADFLRAARRASPRRYVFYLAQYAVVAGGHGAALALAIAARGPSLGLATYASAMGVPALGALWGLMFTNYLQHVDCDPWSRYDHSRNFVSAWMNWLLFDNGFHTVHHEHPGLHWSRVRQVHARIAHLIDGRLQESSLFGYCFKVYVLGRFIPRFTAVPVGSYDPPPLARAAPAG